MNSVHPILLLLLGIAAAFVAVYFWRHLKVVNAQGA
jgi:hypothetical protein